MNGMYLNRGTKEIEFSINNKIFETLKFIRKKHSVDSTYFYPTKEYNVFLKRPVAFTKEK